MSLKNLLLQAIQLKASDLHLSTGLPPLLRVNGELQQLESITLTTEMIHALLKEYLNEAQQAALLKKRELDFAIHIPELARFRINVFQQHRGLAAALRVIPQQVPTLNDLQLPPVMQTLSQLSQGLILITGATGSGKSTTLAALVNHINQTQRKHIITIEDPIEFVHASQQSLIQQREVHRDTESFATALRAALREDPDIILVGELRDLPTIRLALTAAETGHLVLGTLHTASAAKTINRLIDVFPGEEKNLARTLLAESLQAVICQKLVKNMQGGRTAALEVMLATLAIRNLIREDKIAQMISVMQTNKQAGMQTLEQHLQWLVQQNIISANVAQREVC